MHKLTRLGSSVNVPKLGLFERNKPREVELGKDLLAQLSRGRLWSVEEIKPPKPKAPAKKE